MAQLIKLRDYISRYEWNIFRYPTQFIRLKQENWQKLKTIWEEKHSEKMAEEDLPQQEKQQRFFGLWALFHKKAKAEQSEFAVQTPRLPADEHLLKQYFLDKLFPSQLKWATSTVTDVSFISQKYHYDKNLKYFLQRFPDTYLLMYNPIFSIKETPVDGEIIMISPIGIEIIHLFPEDMPGSITADDGRFWNMELRGNTSSILNPFISLKRTEQIIRSIFHQKHIDFPIQKTVLAPNLPIYFHKEPYQARIIGSREYAKWFKEKRALVSPLKSRQLHVAEALLLYCQTNAVKRPEWEEDEEADAFTFSDGEMK
ncbi:NERD domain-containing protein [Virgibacillus sp. 179-BFC.A HS]|uniref:NERD domain-containing protein n=1 Tax=Tigheibacillus jepli TaxID=3035914 RepID=A0ABU5CHJ1_9BACI|nr:NERD domain-containing protein [Virgibacillus sp. 179-BFC.A HS]MDY0405297.1 NERD domain-containing protein [Virgibacillus sp. 179-BFC.A HS]